MAENLKPGFPQSGFWASRTAVVLGSPGNGQRGGSQRCPHDSPRTCVFVLSAKELHKGS